MQIQDVTGTNFPLIVDDLETSPFSLSFGEVANSDEDLLAGTTRLARFLSDRKSGSPFAYGKCLTLGFAIVGLHWVPV